MTHRAAGGGPRALPLARRSVDFRIVNAAALNVLPALVARWLPGGRQVGREWVCGNLHGDAGESCRVNTMTGRWSDFGTGEKGGDPVSLAAAIHRIGQVEAARRLAVMLGLEDAQHG